MDQNQKERGKKTKTKEKRGGKQMEEDIEKNLHRIRKMLAVEFTSELPYSRRYTCYKALEFDTQRG